MERQTCSECDKPIMARGFCSTHYHRWYKGRPLHGRNKFSPNEIRIGKDFAELDVYNKDNSVAYTTLVDVVDVKRISGFRWGHVKASDRRQWGPYIVRHGKGGKRKTIYLHRFLMEPIPNGHWVDHLDGNTLDNRKQNLRIATPAENVWNQRNQQGVRLQENGWIAAISRKFDSEKEALEQRQIWEKARI